MNTITNSLASVIQPPGFRVKAVNGITFNTRRVDKGDSYGTGFQLIWDKNSPMLEFYDWRFPFTPWGQFISRYYLETLIKDRKTTEGLNLCGHVNEWRIDAASLQKVLEYHRGS